MNSTFAMLVSSNGCFTPNGSYIGCYNESTIREVQHIPLHRRISFALERIGHRTTESASVWRAYVERCLSEAVGLHRFYDTHHKDVLLAVDLVGEGGCPAATHARLMALYMRSEGITSE